MEKDEKKLLLDSLEALWDCCEELGQHLSDSLSTGDARIGYMFDSLDKAKSGIEMLKFKFRYP